MAFIIYFLLPMLGSFFLLGAMFYGAYRIAERSMAHKTDIAHWGMTLAYIAVSVALSMLGNTWVNLAGILLFPFVATWVFGTSGRFIVPYYILAVVVFMTDAVIGIVYQLLWISGILYLNSQELSYSLLVVTSRMLEFMVILLITIVVRKKAGGRILVRQVVLSIFLPLFSIFNMYTTLYMMQVYITTDSVVLFTVNMVLLIGLNIYFCVLIDIMGENRRLENERDLYRQQAMMQYRYYEQEEEKYEESRKLIHDIRNHIQAMEDLYHWEGAEDAAKYAGDIHKMLNCFQQRYYTAEKLLNLILNDKVQYMQREGVREDIKVGELSLAFMKDTDVTVLFANLLDNAIGAASKCPEGYVRLRVNMVRQLLSIVLENSCDEAPVKEGESFRSRKKGHKGQGVANIRRTVEQYGGDVQFAWKDGVFTTKVVLVCEAPPSMK